MSPRVLPMRTLQHPGPVNPERRRAIPVELARRNELCLEPGTDLYTSIHALLEIKGVAGCAFALRGGSVEGLRLMTCGGVGGGLPLAFRGPHHFPTTLQIVAGTGVTGVDQSGARFTHCHAIFRKQDGALVGGHLLPQRTIAGRHGIVVAMTTFTGARFARRMDMETGFVVFHPEAA